MSDDTHNAPPEPDHPAGHELSDVDTRGLLTFLASLMASLAIVAAIVYWQYRRFEYLAQAGDPPPAPRAGERQPPAPPLLQVDEPADMSRMLAEQEPQLTRLEWVSRDDKLVRIPVERAMEIIATRGMPQWPAENPMQNPPPADSPPGEPPPP